MVDQSQETPDNTKVKCGLAKPEWLKDLGRGVPQGRIQATLDGRAEDMRTPTQRLKVLFLCTGNSCRSQMAEGWARTLKSEIIEPYSAGLKAHGLNRVAVKVMAKVGVDISQQWSKTVDKLRSIDFDYVVTVCDYANETCPAFHGEAKLVHRGFDDPPSLAARAASDEEALGHYERVRDEIRAFIETLPEALLRLHTRQQDPLDAVRKDNRKP